MPNQLCPPAEELYAYLVGSVPETIGTRLDGHVTACDKCQGALGGLSDADDTFLSQLRRAGECPSSDDEEVKHLDAKLRRTVIASPDAAPLPTAIDSYDVIEQLGRGGGGVVYLARHRDLQRLVAIKLLAAERLYDRPSRERFRREMRAVAQLDHPHIVRATDAGFWNDQPFLVMEYVPGLTVAELVARCGPLDINAACEIAAQAANGLAAAHRAGIVHRDVKPANLMLGRDGRVRVLDLGLARFEQVEQSEELTQSGCVVGTAGFLAPEQAAEGNRADARADIYGLGATLYFMIAGRGPFSGPKYDTSLKKVLGQLHDVPASITSLRQEVPSVLAEMLHRMLAKRAGERFASITEVAERLEPFRAGADLGELVRQAESQPATMRTNVIANEKSLAREPFADASPKSLRWVGWVAAVGLLFLAVATYAAMSKSKRDKEESANKPVERKVERQPERRMQPPPAAKPPTRPASIAMPNTVKETLAGPVEAELPIKYETVVTGGFGRYLIFHDVEESKLLLFDVLSRRTTGEIPNVPQGNLIAANIQKLFIVSPTDMTVSRWDLASRKREKVRALVGDADPLKALIGDSGDGPLLLAGETPRVLNPETLEPIAIVDKVIGAVGRYGYSMQVSRDGRSFVGITQGITNQAYELMRITGDRTRVVQFGRIDGVPRWGAVTADGSLAFGNTNVFTSHGRPITTNHLFGALIPCVDPRYFLCAYFVEGKTRLAICTVADCRIVWEETGFEELVPRPINSWHDIIPALLSTDTTWRIQYLPWAKLLVTLPLDNQRVFLRPLVLEEKLSASGVDFLFVESVPPQQVNRGETLSHDIRAASRLGSVTFRLEDGPAGMQVTKQGRLTWKVPADFAPEFVRTVVSLHDRRGHEALHSFEMVVHRTKLMPAEEINQRD